MNQFGSKLRSLALLAAVASAAVSSGCSSSSTKSQAESPQGGAKVGVSMSALQATNITSMTLTIGVDATSGAPSFPSITTQLTNNDPVTKKLNWSAFVQGIPAGTGRLFTVQAFDGSTPAKVIYSGTARADVTVGATAAVYIVLQGLDDGGFSNSLPAITSLTSSTSIVTVGTTPPPAAVSLGFHAVDPDANATMTYSWTSGNCPGTTFSPDTSTIPAAVPASGDVTVLWTPPTTVPAGNACSLNLIVTDNKGGSVATWLVVQVNQNTNGSATVNAYPNSWPAITSLVVTEYFNKNANGSVKSVEFDIIAQANDADGDDIQYQWSVGGAACTSANSGYTATLPLVATPAIPLVYPKGQNTQSQVHFTTDTITSACILKLDVTDYWKGGTVPAGSGLPVARGGDTVGLINGSLAATFAIAPLITFESAPNAPQSPQDATSATFVVNVGQIVNLNINVVDPTPSGLPAGAPFTFTWTQSGGTLGTAANVQPPAPGSPGSSANSWTAAGAYVAGSFVKVTVKSAQGPESSYTWYFKPANPCDGTSTAACDPGIGKCADLAYGTGTNLGGTCQVGSTVCKPNAPVTCGVAAQCQQAGVCQPSTGTCTFANATAGTACNADSNGCTPADTCNANGACVADTAFVCNAPADAQCQAALGTCNSTSNTTHTCTYAANANGSTCNKDSNGCTQNDSCQSGVCTVGTPVVCTSASVCQVAAGVCNSTGANTYTCGFTNLTDGTACNTAGACQVGQTCVAGACANNGMSACAAGQSCSVVGGSPVCSASVVAPQFAQNLAISVPLGLAMDNAGATYAATSIYLSATGVNFGNGVTANSAGDADILVAKYNSSHVAQWAVTFGDGATANPQAAVGAAVTQDGTVAVIGNFSGNFSIGTSLLNSTPQIDFLAGISGSNGAGLWAKQFNNGGGAFKAVAANANDATPVPPATTGHGNRIAVCGFTNTSAPADFVTGATLPLGNDIIIGAFTSGGTKLWSKQIGSTTLTQDEDCGAIAVDDNGDVWASGTFSGASLDFGTPTLPLTGPGNANRTYLWVAKFNGSTGAPIFSAAFSGTGGGITPSGLVVDASGNVIVGGSFTGNVSFGTVPANTLTSAGQLDGFVAKLSPALAPVWAVRIGGAKNDVLNGVAVDSFGDVIAVGGFYGTTTGVAVLTATGTTATDAFVLKLNGSTGAKDSASAYGDAQTQAGDAVVTNRFGTTPNNITVGGTISGTMNFGAPAGSITATGVNQAYVLFSTLQ